MTTITCGGPGHHVIGCYARVTTPCPGCGVPVRNLRLDCGTEDLGEPPPIACTPCALACRDCPAEVRGGPRRWRVVHAEACPWLRRHLAREVSGCIPCGCVVTHRGPYKRRSAA